MKQDTKRPQKELHEIEIWSQEMIEHKPEQ